MGLQETLVCDRCQNSQALGSGPSLMLMLDTPKEPRRVWHLCAECSPLIIAVLEKPAEVVDGEPPAEPTEPGHSTPDVE